MGQPRGAAGRMWMCLRSCTRESIPMLVRRGRTFRPGTGRRCVNRAAAPGGRLQWLKNNTEIYYVPPMKKLVSVTLLLLLAHTVSAQPAPDAAELTKLLNDFLAGASRNDAAIHE